MLQWSHKGDFACLHYSCSVRCWSVPSMLMTPLKHIFSTHTHTADRDLTGCRSTAWTDQQTRPAAAGVAKTWQLSSIATPWTLSSSPDNTFWVSTEVIHCGGPCGLSMGVCVCVSVINVRLPVRDSACVKRMGEPETPFSLAFYANCIGDDIVASVHFSVQWGEVALLSHWLC